MGRTGVVVRFWPRRPTLMSMPLAAAEPQEAHMLETLIAVLVILWLLGMVSSYTIGGLIHLLLVLAIIVVLLRVIQGRRVV